MILFGSRAQGEHLTWSDYDLAVISDGFRGMQPEERGVLVLECWQGERALEPVCYTIEEFEASSFSIADEIRKKGVVVYGDA